jgi:LCP family protein required for cell wall assembly
VSSSYPAGPGAPLPPHLDPRGRQRSGWAWSPRASRITLIFFTLLSVALVIVAGYYWVTFRDINNGVHRLKVDVGSPPATASTDIDGKSQNILLVGNDDRSNMTNAEVRELKVGRDGGSKATDTMMIVHIPADGSRATVISLPRDSWVHIAGHGMNRLNAAYVDGYDAARGTADQRRTAGADLLIKTVGNLTGLTIDHYVQVSLLGFYDISNAIGGVPINLCHSVNDTIAANKRAGLQGGSGFKMSKGHHTIQGVQALEFVRQRHFLPNGDLDRVRRQQYFLTAAFRKIASVGLLFKLNALGAAVTRNFYMDHGLNLINLARQMENLSADNIRSETIPTAPETIDGNSVLAVNPKRVQAFVETVVNPPAPTTSSSTPAKKKTSGAKKSTTKKTGAIDAKCIN